MRSRNNAKNLNVKGGRVDVTTSCYWKTSMTNEADFDVSQNCRVRATIHRRQRPTKTQHLANSRHNSSKTANNRRPVATARHGDSRRSQNILLSILFGQF